MNTLQNPSPYQIKQIPFLFGYLKEIVNKSINTTVLLKDNSGETMCTLSKTLMAQYGDMIKVGSLLVLQDVSKFLINNL